MRMGLRGVMGDASLTHPTASEMFGLGLDLFVGTRNKSLLLLFFRKEGLSCLAFWMRFVGRPLTQPSPPEVGGEGFLCVGG